MLDSISTRFTNDDADETTSESETRSRRRFLRRTATGVGAITTVGAGTGTAAATRRYEVRRLRTRTSGQPAIEDVELVHDRRLFGEDVFFIGVSPTNYALRYDRQWVTVSRAENWEWDASAMDRSVGDQRTHRILHSFDIPALQTPRLFEPIAIKVWTKTDPGQGDWLSQERTVVEPAGNGRR